MAGQCRVVQGSLYRAVKAIRGQFRPRLGRDGAIMGHTSVQCKVMGHTSVQCMGQTSVQFTTTGQTSVQCIHVCTVGVQSASWPGAGLELPLSCLSQASRLQYLLMLHK